MKERSQQQQQQKSLRAWCEDLHCWTSALDMLMCTCVNAHVHHTQEHTSDTEMHIYTLWTN